MESVGLGLPLHRLEGEVSLPGGTGTQEREGGDPVAGAGGGEGRSV